MKKMLMIVLMICMPGCYLATSDPETKQDTEPADSCIDPGRYAVTLDKEAGDCFSDSVTREEQWPWSPGQLDCSGGVVAVDGGCSLEIDRTCTDILGTTITETGTLTVTLPGRLEGTLETNISINMEDGGWTCFETSHVTALHLP